MQNTNPINGEVIDLTPLHTLMADQAVSVDGIENVTQRLQYVHDFMSTRVLIIDDQVDLEEWAKSNYILVELRKVFEQMRL